MRPAAGLAVGLAAEILFVLILALSPLPNGCLLEGPGDARWQTLMDAGLFLVLILTIAQNALLARPFRTPRVWLPLAILLAYVLFQVLPLPFGILAAVSPAAGRWVSLAVPEGADWAAISLCPQLTLLEGLRLAAYLAALFVVVNRFRTVGGCVRLAVWMTLIGVAMAVIGFIQQATAPPFTLLWTWNLERWGAPFGPYVSKNHFAGLMEIGVACSLALLVRGAAMTLVQSEGMSFWARTSLLLGRGAHRVVLPFLAFALMMAGLVASRSRGGWIAMAIALLALVMWGMIVKRSRMAWKAGLVILLAVAGVVTVLGPERFESRFTIQARAVNRPRIWQDSARMWWDDYRAVGAGAGTFLYSFQPYHRFPDKRLATHAESDWLQTITGVGLIGMALLVWAAVRFGRAIRAGLVGDLTPERGFLAAGMTGILALLGHGFVDVNLQIPANGLHFAVLAGLCLARARLQGGRGVLYWIDGGSPSERPVEEMT